MKIRLKKNDMVKVIAGRDRGKQGKVTQVFPDEQMVVVEGINLRTKHLKSRKAGQPGSKIQFAAPLRVNKVMALCPHCGKTTRVRHQKNAQGVNARMCHHCSQPLVA